MLWRPTYQTLVARDVAIPLLATHDQNPLPRFQVLVAGFDFYAYREMTVWRKLLTSEPVKPEFIQGFFLHDVSKSNISILDALIPESDQPRTFTLMDVDDAWKELIAPQNPQQSFAAVVRESLATIMIKGIPTEDGWDAFRTEMLRGS